MGSYDPAAVSVDLKAENQSSGPNLATLLWANPLLSWKLIFLVYKARQIILIIAWFSVGNR